MKCSLSALLVVLYSFVSAQDGMPTAPEIREMIAGQIQSFNITPKPIFRKEDRKVWNGADSIAIRIYYPSPKKNLRIIYNVHGGALVAGDLDTHENVCIELANRCNSVVVAVDYRKPPEHPFPASLNDVETVLAWIKKNSKTLNGNASNLVLTGDSGGGLQVTALALKLKKGLGAKGIVLINPAEDLRTPGEGMYGLVTNWYLNGHPASDSLASPIVGVDYHGIPPTLVITCGKDELKPHGLAIIDKLKSCGASVSTFDLPDEDHLGGFWAGAHPKAQPALDKTVAFIIGLKR